MWNIASVRWQLYCRYLVWHQYQLSPQMYSRLIIDSPLVYQDQLNDGKHKNSQHRRFIYIETLSIPMTIITVGGGNQGQYIFIQLFFGSTSNIFCLFIQLRTASRQQQDLSSSVFTVQHFRPSACADIYMFHSSSCKLELQKIFAKPGDFCSSN